MCQVTAGLSTTAIFGNLDGYTSLVTSEIRPVILYGDMLPLVYLWVIAILQSSMATLTLNFHYLSSNITTSTRVLLTRIHNDTPSHLQGFVWDPYNATRFNQWSLLFIPNLRSCSNTNTSKQKFSNVYNKLHNVCVTIMCCFLLQNVSSQCSWQPGTGLEREREGRRGRWEDRKQGKGMEPYIALLYRIPWQEYGALLPDLYC